MAGIGQTLLTMLGQGDPEQAISDYSNQELARNRAAAGEDPQGNLLPAPAVNAPTAVGAGALTPDAASIASQQSGILPANQESNATKTPESWGSLLMRLQRSNEQSQGLNQSIGMGFAAFAQPRDREMVSKMFNVDQPDPTKIINAQMNASSLQQGQDRTNSLGQMVNDPTRGPAMAQRLNISWDELKARFQADPAGVGTMIQTYAAPTDQMKNIEQINTYVAQAGQRGQSPEVLTMIKNAMLAGMGGPQAEAAIGDAVAFKNRTGKDAPWVVNGNIDQRAYAQFTANEQQKETERGKASNTLATNIGTAEELRTNLENLRDSPGLQSILGDAVKREAALKAMKAANDSDVPSILSRYVLSDDEKAAIATLRKITGASTESAMQSMAGTGTRVTQQEVGPLKDAISSVTNLNQNYGSYVHGAINPFITKIKKTIANTYGASGNLNHMDPEYEPWLNDIYRARSNGQPGGELYKEGGGAENIPNLQPLPDNKLAWAKSAYTARPDTKDDILDSLQQDGFNVSRLRKTDPSKW